MPAAEKTDAYAAMVVRLGHFIAVIGAIASVGVAIQFTWQDAAGFAFGALAAYLNMRWLANGLLHPERMAARLFLLRFLLVGGAAYVILKVFGTGPLFILAGLLSAALAVVLEALFQIFYART